APQSPRTPRPAKAVRAVPQEGEVAKRGAMWKASAGTTRPEPRVSPFPGKSLGTRERGRAPRAETLPTRVARCGLVPSERCPRQSARHGRESGRDRAVQAGL